MKKLFALALAAVLVASAPAFGETPASSVPQFRAVQVTSNTVAVGTSQVTLVAAEPLRVGIEIQPNVPCKVSNIGATMTSAAAVLGEGGIRVTAADGLYQPIATTTAAYTIICTGSGLATYTQYTK